MRVVVAGLVLALASSNARSAPKAPKPTLTVTEPVVRGAIAPKAVAAKIRSSSSALLGCYRAARTRAPELESTLAAGFSIGRDGKVADFDLRGRLDDAAETCVAGVLRKLAFGAQKAATDAVVRLTFHMGDYDEAWPDGMMGAVLPINDDFPATDSGHALPVPELFVKTVTVTGALDAALVRRSTKRELMALEHCYQTATMTTIQATLAGDGSVTSTKIDVPDPGAEACLTKAVGRIKFPKPTDGQPASATIPIAYLAPS